MTGNSREKSDRDGENPEDISELLDSDSGPKQFFDYAGPLFSALISPKSSVVSVDKRKKYHVICRDRSRRVVLENLVYQWSIADGEGQLNENHQESYSRIDGRLTEFRSTLGGCPVTMNPGATR